MQTRSQVEDPGPEKVVGLEEFAVGRRRDGIPFAVDRRCRHLGADLAEGTVEDACLVCPWHGAVYEVGTGRMVRGPQGVFARIPLLGRAFRTLTAIVPLRKRDVVAEDGRLRLVR